MMIVVTQVSNEVDRPCKCEVQDEKGKPGSHYMPRMWRRRHIEHRPVPISAHGGAKQVK